MRAVRVPRLAALALGAIVLGGATTTPALAGKPIEARSASALGPVRAPARARAATSHGPTVTAALASLQRSGAITPAIYRRTTRPTSPPSTR
jgi:hypothetical protein